MLEVSNVSLFNTFTACVKHSRHSDKGRPGNKTRPMGSNYDNNRTFKNNNKGKERKEHEDMEHSLKGHTMLKQWFTQFKVIPLTVARR